MLENFRVSIIGAGSTGLLLAQGLKKNGIKAVVYEREDTSTYQTRPREWGMTLHWGQSFIDQCIPSELVEGLNEGICCDPFHREHDSSLPHYNGETGEKMFDTPGDKPRRVSRRKLRNYLSQGLEIQYGKRLSSITSEANGLVKAIFHDSSCAIAHIVVGADGAHSATRRLLFPDPTMSEATPLDIQMINTSCRFPVETALLQRHGHPIFKNSYHPAGFMWWQSIQDVSVAASDDPSTWVFQNALSWMGEPRASDFQDSKAILDFWREQAKLFADPWKTVGQHFPDNLRLVVDSVNVWSPSMNFHDLLPHSVTLAGDAAHTMPPHRGQGLNNALQDAAQLVVQLCAVVKQEKSLQEGITEYEHEMKERALVEVAISREQAKMVHSFDTLMQAPIVKHGLYKYKANLKREGTQIEKADEPKIE